MQDENQLKIFLLFVDFAEEFSNRFILSGQSTYDIFVIDKNSQVNT